MFTKQELTIIQFNLTIALIGVAGDGDEKKFFELKAVLDKINDLIDSL